MLSGKYVKLRSVEKNDLEQLREWRNRPEYRRYFREFREINEEQQMRWFENLVIKDPNTLMFSIIDANTEQLLGACGLCYIDWVNKNADFSIYIGHNNLYIDDTYAVDAAKVMGRYGFEELGLHRLWAEIYDFDEPKKALFDTLKFKLDGHHRETHWAEGRWHGSLFYSILEGEMEY